MCVLSSHLFWTSGLWTYQPRSQGHTRFFHLPPAVLALKKYSARRIQPFLSLVDREVEFCSVIVGNFPAVKLPPWWAEAVIWCFTAIFWCYRIRQSRYHQKEKKRLPPYGITAKQLPPYFGFTASTEVVTAKTQKFAYRRKITAVWHYRPKSTAIICDTAYKSTAMSEWSERIALRFLIGNPIAGVQTHAGTSFFGFFFVLCSSVFLVLSGSISLEPLV